MSYDQLTLPPRMKCGHPRTTENVGAQGKCLTCKRQYMRDRNLQDQEIRAEIGLQGLRELGITGIVGNEFDRARKRAATRLTRSLRR